PTPVTANIGEFRLRIPLAHTDIQLGLRLQDDQPRPDKGFAAAAELSLTQEL
ncbi:MAG: hypothetical protein ISS15_06110, partial [Alphaproteobacteria bacterium]|nr:hypothetical protein [Alphaproteobacteria bacterium]MBL7097214.1 hypothetical protein [Alphaproteobacteria bacterium]